MRYSNRLSLALAGATFLSMSGTAFALDGNDLLAKINAAFSQGGTLKAETNSVSGSTVTLTGVSILPNGKEADAVRIGDVKLEGVEEDTKGGYKIGTATFPNVDITNKGVNITATDLIMEGVTIPGDPTQKSIESIILYESAHTGPVKVMQNGAEVFSIAETTASLVARDDKSGIDFETSATGVKADLTRIEDPKAKDVLSKLKLTSLNGEFTTSGSWEAKTGALDIQEIALDFDDIGRLNFALGISGYTLDLVQSLKQTVETMNATTGTNQEQAQQAAGLAMMGLIQQLSFVSAQISFEDDSITNRLLDYFGAEQGVTGKQLAQSLKGMVPLIVAQLNIPDLQNQISEAVNAYLDEPQNITISADPEKAVPFPMIMGAGMGAPLTLPKVLGVSVSANDDL